ncbi:MAG: tRNA (guanosine(46)-N7)-methyltransferase TrmB [bacterium]
MRNKTKKFVEFSASAFSIEAKNPDAKIRLEKLFAQYPKITLELGCGRGEYTIGLAEKYPNELFIGVDIQGERLWSGAKRAADLKLTNVCFFRCLIDKLALFIPEKSIKAIWLTFPDPFPKEKHFKRRLTYRKYLLFYQKILKKYGVINLKTDSPKLSEFTKKEVAFLHGEILTDISNIYEKQFNKENIYITTCFEQRQLQRDCTIKFLSFHF